jgi:hypothetical protein
MYKVFTRTFWKRDPKGYQGRSPHLGRRTTLAQYIDTEEEAQAICRQYNDTHEPGFLSRKAEYERT